jgi:para-aminobenzoate synthetase / 4-amino-4-deoxychorismate lyase
MSGQSKLSIFLENNRTHSAREAAYIYNEPVEIISVKNPEGIESGFKRIEDALGRGLHVAGFISYEAGLCLEGRLKGLLAEKLDYPLIHMGVYKEREVISAQDADHYWRGFENTSGYALSDIKLSLSRDDYEKAFERIQDYQKAGDIYQVNFTQKASFDFEGSARSFYASLRNAQAVEYAAYIESDAFRVLSLSPELFVKKVGDKITVKPMKGTCKRGGSLSEDHIYKEELRGSEKEKAENLMIVDLMRNDLSRLARKGCVNVRKLFDVEKYKTFFTMTSTVEATAADDVSALDVMTSIFPCGSVTGAPKIRAQEIIAELENRERGIYTGAIGYFTPSGDMCFSVPIRTITIDNAGNGELGIGSGIVADSEAQNEYDECLLKAEFVTKDHPRFDLIESLGWSAGEGFKFMDRHLDRLESSADYFDFSFDRDDAAKQLNDHAKIIEGDTDQKYKLRLLLSKKGDVTITSEAIETTEAGKVVISDKPVDSAHAFLFHKTTERSFFSREFNKYQIEPGLIDVLFLNERGELTEGSYTNLFIKKGDTLYTPPLECGLLGGIFRQCLLDDETFKTEEKILYPEDLKSADQIYLCNSVRGIIPAQLDEN